MSATGGGRIGEGKDDVGCDEESLKDAAKKDTEMDVPAWKALTRKAERLVVEELDRVGLHVARLGAMGSHAQMSSVAALEAPAPKAVKLDAVVFVAVQWKPQASDVVLDELGWDAVAWPALGLDGTHRSAECLTES